MTNRVDALVDAVEPAIGESAAHRAIAQADPSELGEAGHPVLGPGQISDGEVG